MTVMTPRVPKETRASRTTKSGERGQVMVLFILILATSVLIAVVAVSVGQVLVRRQQAQMVVDAAALAGAGSQARGLNTIAMNNKNSLRFLQMIEASTYLPYMDNDDTTWTRMGVFLFPGGWALPFTSDWAGEVLEDYQDVFNLMNTFTDAVNLAYSPVSPLPFSPGRQAATVVDENFGSESERLFRDDDLESHGVVNPIDKWLSSDYWTKLVQLTEPEDDYNIGSHYYAPYWNNALVQTCTKPFPANIPCALPVATYASLNAYYWILDPIFDPIEYELGKFYDNEEGDDVRFCYSLTISQSPVLFGKKFFDDIPSVTVVAAAKPYGGYMGDKFEEGFWGHGEQDGKEIKFTYAPKLVPLKSSEKMALTWNPLVWPTILH